MFLTSKFGYFHENAFAIITEDMLKSMWREIDYRLDVHCATKGEHIGGY
jgi:hypothetical protein